MGRFEAELRPLRRALPRHALIGYVGPSQDETCHPMMVAQYALAPAWLTELEDPRLPAAGVVRFASPPDGSLLPGLCL